MNKKAIHTHHAPSPVGPYNQAIAAGNMLFISGQVPITPETGVLIGHGIEEQAEQVLQNLDAILRAAGLTQDHVVKTSIFLLDMSDFPLVNKLYGDYFCGVAPARETIQVAALPVNAKIEISAIACINECA